MLSKWNDGKDIDIKQSTVILFLAHRNYSFPPLSLYITFSSLQEVRLQR
jgi:hypothetical protein